MTMSSCWVELLDWVRLIEARRWRDLTRAGQFRSCVYRSHQTSPTCQNIYPNLIQQFTYNKHHIMPPSKADTLARLRAARQAGKTGFSSYEVQDEEQLYETVDEDSYKKIVRKRLDQDDFVVDDNGEGYADEGREDWQNEQQQEDYDESDNDDLPARSKAGDYRPSSRLHIPTY
jgi:hypothetical protein